MTIKVVVPVSGGKDSQACLQLALETHDKGSVLGLFCDTRFEHPKTYRHIEWMRAYYGVDIVTRSYGNVPDKVRKYGRFPLGGSRFCTEELKIYPSKYFYKELALEQGMGFEVWYGMRNNESEPRKRRYKDTISTELYLPNDYMRKYPKYLGKMGVRIRMPIIEWSLYDVLEYLGDVVNPLYGEGFDRVGCFPCLAAGDKTKTNAFIHDDFGKQQYELVKQLEAETGKSVWSSKDSQAKHDHVQSENSGCGICSI